MKPDDQRGYVQPNPAQSTTPVVPAQSIHPVQPIQPARSAAPVVNPAALQAALSEPTPANPVTSPALAPVPPSPVNEPVNDDYDEDDYDDQLADGEDVTWVAKEYIHQEKGAKWFVIFAIVVVALLAISIFFMKSWSFAVLLGVIAVVVVVYSRRPPRELTYSLSDEGLTVDGILHEFSKFKSFGIIPDGEEYSVMLIPTRRFQPGVTVYFPEEAGEDIVDMLGSRLPMKELHLDAVDRVVRLLRL
jgi:hypothetical protein